MIKDIFFDEPYGKCRVTFEKNFVHIWGLYVSHEFRCAGKAKKLLLKVIKVIRDLGYSGEIQIVAKSEEPGICDERLKNFYKSMGLKVFDYYG